MFSQDLKRLVSYSLRSFKLNSRNVEFSRSVDYNFFRFVVSLILKMVFKLDENLIKKMYFNEGNNSISSLLSNLLVFLVSRNQKEDLLVRKSNSMLKFFLRMFCLIFYQKPLYTHLVNELQTNLISVLSIKPTLLVFGCENKNVNSAFISRFLSRKLAQKYK